MIGVEITGLEAPAALIKRLGKNADAAMSIALLRCAQRADSDIKSEVYDTFNPGTGDLARKFKAVMLDAQGPTLRAGAVSDLVYAGIQNEGGTILPKTVKNLAIPNRNLVPRGKWPRKYPKGSLSFVPSLKGNPRRTGWLIDKLSKRRMFTLMKSVTIEGRNYLEAAQEKSEPHFQRIINTELVSLIQKSEKAAK